MLQEFETPEQFVKAYEDFYETRAARAEEQEEQVLDLIELFKTQPCFHPDSYKITNKYGFHINVAPAVFTRFVCEFGGTTPIWGVKDEFLGTDAVHDLTRLWPLVVRALESDEHELCSLEANGKPVDIWLTLSEGGRWVYDRDEDGCHDTFFDEGEWLEVTLVRSPFNPENILLTRLNKLSWK